MSPNIWTIVNMWTDCEFAFLQKLSSLQSSQCVLFDSGHCIQLSWIFLLSLVSHISLSFCSRSKPPAAHASAHALWINANFKKTELKPLDQWSQTQFLEGHSSWEFSSNQLQITPVWKFRVFWIPWLAGSGVFDLGWSIGEGWTNSRVKLKAARCIKHHKFIF